jgi:hypothetical protein
MCVLVNVRVHVLVHVYMHVLVCVYMHVCVCVYAHVYVCVRVCVCARVYSAPAVSEHALQDDETALNMARQNQLLLLVALARIQNVSQGHQLRLHWQTFSNVRLYLHTGIHISTGWA